MSCITCLKYTGTVVNHGEEGCALIASMLCRRCHHRGHLTNMCTYGVSQWERPTCLEELIPHDVRARYGINTVTPMTFAHPRCVPESEAEIADINEIVIPDDYTQLTEFVKRHKIVVPNTKTKKMGDACIAAIREWGIQRGVRIVVALKKPAPAPLVVAA